MDAVGRSDRLVRSAPGEGAPSLPRATPAGDRSSFPRQIERAIARQNEVSVQQRTAALLASYFGPNRVVHPGENRLLTIDRCECPLLPANLEGIVGELIVEMPPPWDDGRLVASTCALIDGLDALLDAEWLR